MTRMPVYVALIAFVVSSSGCCCLDWCRPRAIAPAACPPPAPVCDPCTTAPVTYGGAPAPVMPYTPPPQW
jgi:hypothetical protein